MSFSVKDGVQLDRMHPAMAAAWPTIMQVFAKHGYVTTITSGNEGEHMRNSLHKVIPCRANDFRTWANAKGQQMDAGLKAAIATDIRKLLGKDYDVVVEGTHIHVEFDPK